MYVDPHKPELGILNTMLKANKCIDVLVTISGR